jgi:hypothetical protein
MNRPRKNASERTKMTAADLCTELCLIFSSPQVGLASRRAGF